MLKRSIALRLSLSAFAALLIAANPALVTNFTMPLVANGCDTTSTVDGQGSASGTTPNNDPDFGLDPNLDPWDNFDLSVWGLDSPAIENVNASVPSGEAPEGVRIDDFEFIALSDGPSNSDFDQSEDLFFGQNGEAESTDPFFFTANDGGMVFKSPVNGARTSANTRFPRSELREYVRGGVTRRPNGETISTSGVNENNWVLGYQPNLIFDDNDRDESIENVGGRNGRLAATLRVNKVTVTGRPDDVGVTIIGQIHAQDDEPLRLYYRKLPGFDLGSVYAVHEIRRSRGDETPVRFGRDAPDINLVGTSTDLDDLQRDGLDTNEIETILADGIALDELFSYEIINEGELITVNLMRGDITDPIIASTTINMATIVNQRSEAANDPVGSGYDRADEWMYFKAGAYTQNNSDVEEFDGVNTPGAATTGFGPNGNEPDFDQVTFYRLSVSHDENIVGANNPSTSQPAGPFVALQAEDFSAVLDDNDDEDDDIWMIVDDSSALGGQAIEAPSGSRTNVPNSPQETVALYNLAFSETGTYTAYFRARGINSSTDSFFAPNGFGVNPTIRVNTANEGVYEWVTSGETFTIDSSDVGVTQELRIGRREGLNRIDAIVFHRTDDLTAPELDAFFIEPDEPEDSFLLGDVNLDGSVNILDITPFISRLASGAFQDEADINGDGTVNILDITPFISLLQ